MNLLLGGVILTVLSFENLFFIIPLLILFFYLIKKRFYKIIIILIMLIILISIFKIELFKQQKDNYFLGIVYKSRENYFYFFSNFKCYYVYSENNNYEVFDILFINGESAEILNNSLEGEFDFKEYLYYQNIDSEIIYSSIDVKYYFPLRKKVFFNKFLSNFSPISKNYLSMMLFNNSGENLDDLYRLGLTYYFSFSGIHIYFLYNSLDKIILYFTSNKQLSKKISFALITLFFIISNFKIAFLKSLILIFNREIINNRYKRSKILSLLLLIIILINNRYIYSSEIIYTFGLSYISPIIFESTKSLNQKYKRLFSSVIFILIINTLGLFYDGEINILNIVMQFLLLPLSNVLFVIAFTCLLFPFYKIVDSVSFFIDKIIKMYAKFSIKLYIYENNFLLLIVLIVIIICLLYFLEIRLFKLSKFVFVSYYLCICLFTCQFDACISQYVYFINVGQGDCALIHNRNYNILIDTGGSIYKDIACEILIPFFNKKHIKKIDLIFISHDDFDHNGALDSLKNNFYVGEIIIGSNFDTLSYKGIEFKNLNKYKRGFEENDNSSVLYFYFIKRKFLFMGDASTLIENKILEDNKWLDVDILKVGHHGSNTSSSFNFLKSITPKEAIISVGVNNYYNHPDNKVIYRLEQLNVKIRRTDIEGSIVYY